MKKLCFLMATGVVMALWLLFMKPSEDIFFIGLMVLVVLGFAILFVAVVLLTKDGPRPEPMPAAVRISCKFQDGLITSTDCLEKNGEIYCPVCLECSEYRKDGIIFKVKDGEKRQLAKHLKQHLRHYEGVEFFKIIAGEANLEEVLT